MVVRALHTDGEKILSMRVYDQLPRSVRHMIDNADVPLPYDEFLNLFKLMQAGAMTFDLEYYVRSVLEIRATIIREAVEKDLNKLMPQ